MERKTWGQMRLELRDELNLGDQGLVENAELMVMANRALRVAEAEVHSLNEDYFRTSDTLTMVQGVSDYDLPTDLFGAKLRLVQFDDGVRRPYQVVRIRPRDVEGVRVQDDYQYSLDNSTAYGMRMRFYPTPRETGAFVTRWYLRRARMIESDATVIDLPEFSSFIFNYVKMQVLLKTEGVTSPMLLQNAQAELQMARDLMVRSLSSCVVDEEEGRLDIDYSFYNESIA